MVKGVRVAATALALVTVLGVAVPALACDGMGASMSGQTTGQAQSTAATGSGMAVAVDAAAPATTPPASLTARPVVAPARPLWEQRLAHAIRAFDHFLARVLRPGLTFRPML